MTSWARNGREFSQLTDRELVTLVRQANISIECGPGSTQRAHLCDEIEGARLELDRRDTQLRNADERNHVPAGAVMLTTHERQLIWSALDLALHAMKIHGELRREDTPAAVERYRKLMERIKP